MTQKYKRQFQKQHCQEARRRRKQHERNPSSLSNLWNLLFCERYLANDEYARWYDNWAKDFEKCPIFK